MPGMQIDLGFGGLGEAVNRLREMERLTAQIGRNQQGGGAAAGPMARLASAQRGLAGAAGGSPEALFDAQVRAIRAQQSVERAQRLLGGGPGLGQRLSSLVSSTRFGGGGALGGAMPLVGRTAAALGIEAGAAGPIGLAIAAVTGFAAVLNSATQTVGEFRRAATMTGGTAGQTAQLAAMGIAPSQQAGAAANLREQLTTNPRAQLAAAQLGIGPQSPRWAGEVNEAAGLRRTLEQLRLYGKEHGVLEQLRVARELMLDGYLDELRVSDRVWNARQRDAQVEEDLMKRHAQTFRDFAAESGRASSAFDNLKVAVGGIFAGTAGEGAGAGADILNALARSIEKTTPFWENALRTGLEAILGPAVSELVFGAGKGVPGTTPTEKNTTAIEENTRILKEGMTGGGPRAAGAIPPALRGRIAAEAFEGERLKLGVFGNSAMAVTPHRSIWLEVDGPEQSTVLRPAWRGAWSARDFARGDGFVAKVNPDGSLLRVSGSTNTTHVPGDAWVLSAINQQKLYSLVSGGSPGAILLPGDFVVPVNVKWLQIFRPPPADAGGGGFTTVAPAMKRRVPRGIAWSHGNNFLGADQAAYPPPTDPDYPDALPLDRVAYSNADFEPNMGFGVTFGFRSEFWSNPAFMRVYFGGNTTLQPTGHVGGAFCLVLRGSGQAILYERGNGPLAPTTWARRHVFMWAEPDNLVDGSHHLFIWPMARDRILFITRITDQPAVTSLLGVQPPFAGAGPTSNPTLNLYQDTPGATGHLHVTSMTGAGKFRIDLRRDYRMPYVPWLLKFPTAGTVVDEPFVIDRPLMAGDEIYLSMERYGLYGANVQAAMHNADTGAVLTQPTPGTFIAHQSQQKYYVTFQLFAGGLAATGNQTPVLFSYAVRAPGLGVIRVNPPTTCRVRDGSVTGPDILPGHGSAQMQLRRAPCLPGPDGAEPMDVFRLHDRRYARLIVKVPTSGPPEAVSDPRGYVVLHAGETWQVKGQLRGRESMGNANWWNYNVTLIDLWIRIQKQICWQLMDYRRDIPHPTIAGEWIPWLVMAVIRDVFIKAGVPEDELDTPGWDDPAGLRLWPGANPSPDDYVLQPGITDLSKLIKRLANDFLGKVVVHDPNAYQGDNLLRGVWRVLDPPQPVPGTGTVDDPGIYPLSQSKALFHVRRPAGAAGLVVEDEGAFGSPQASFVKDQSYFVYAEAPEGTALTISSYGGLFPASNRQGPLKIYAFNWNHKAVDYHPSATTADPSSIDYMDRWEPIVINDPMLPNQNAANYMCARISKQALRGRLWCEWVAPLLLIADPGDPLLGARRRPLRVYDQVTLVDEHGVSRPVMLRSVNPFWTSANQMWAWHQGIFLDTY